MDLPITIVDAVDELVKTHLLSFSEQTRSAIAGWPIHCRFLFGVRLWALCEKLLATARGDGRSYVFKPGCGPILKVIRLGTERNELIRDCAASREQRWGGRNGWEEWVGVAGDPGVSRPVAVYLVSRQPATRLGNQTKVSIAARIKFCYFAYKPPVE